MHIQKGLCIESFFVAMYLKQAKKAIEKAVELEPDNKFVVEQVEAL